MTDTLELSGRPVYTGTHVTRATDDTLLSGRGTYVADLHRPDMAEIAVVRSTVAHGRITEIRTADAAAVPGVIEVITAADLTDVSPFPNFAAYVHTPGTFPLAKEKVRYVGSPVAVVLAEDRYIAEDAAELVEVDYHELPAVTDMDAALEADAPLVFEDWPDNRMLNLQPDDAEVAAILARNRVIKRRYKIGRHTAMPMETRAALAEVVEGGRLQLWPTNQHAHMARTTLSYVLPIPERDIRVTIPYVGGGFGQKQHLYPEDVLVSWLALRHGRPVRFVEDRAEHMIAAAHARDQLVTIEAAVADDGRILGLRSEILQDLGSAEIFPGAYCPAMTTSAHMTGPYDIRPAAVSVVGVTTNKTPGGSYRGYGVPEAVFAVERFIDEVAAEVGVDRLDLRRSMLLDKDDLPYTTPSGALLDSGSFTESFERVVELGEQALERAQARYGAEEDSRLGVGYAVFFEGVSPTHHGASAHWTGHESCSIEIQPDGGVRVASGVTDQGQGTTTFVATLTADALGVPLETVHVELSDTDATPYGLGAFGSRQAVVGGGAILTAATEVRDKVKQIAAHILEASTEDLVIEQGCVRVAGSPEPSVTLAQIATAATIRTLELPPGMEPGLEATARYEPELMEHVPDENGRINPCASYANAAHAVVIRVDLGTGEIEILDYMLAHDCGTVINPPIVDGQIRGGIAQGIGGTLYEDLPYNEDGQPQTAFMDYLVPSVIEMPDLVIEHFESPSPNTPLGIKGAGEGGTVGPAAAIANALAHALAEFAPQVRETPLSPAVVRAMIPDQPGG